MLTLSDVWPLFDLEITSPRLVMRPVRDSDLPGIIDAALAGIHDPAVMPFSVPWTDAPRDELIRETAKHQWRLRASVRPDHWTVNFAVLHDGVPLGIQDLSAADFTATRTVQSGSWLSRRHQGKGFGKEMRAAVLLFAFDHLGAATAESSAAVWNGASLGVSHGLGYRNTAISTFEGRPGETTQVQELRVDAGDFIRPGWDISVAGLERARRDLFHPATTLAAG
jgi:RimJ/RimL family protein N-acetyltransferase